MQKNPQEHLTRGYEIFREKNPLFVWGFSMTFQSSSRTLSKKIGRRTRSLCLFGSRTLVHSCSCVLPSIVVIQCIVYAHTEPDGRTDGQTMHSPESICCDAHSLPAQRSLVFRVRGRSYLGGIFIPTKTFSWSPTQRICVDQ